MDIHADSSTDVWTYAHSSIDRWTYEDSSIDSRDIRTEVVKICLGQTAIITVRHMQTTVLRGELMLTALPIY